jgi:hypothetical protein
MPFVSQITLPPSEARRVTVTRVFQQPASTSVVSRKYLEKQSGVSERDNAALTQVQKRAVSIPLPLPPSRQARGKWL